MRAAIFKGPGAVETGERIIVGVNRFQQNGEAPIPAFRIDPALERAQLQRLRDLRGGRDAAAVEQGLAGLERLARDGGNLMPGILAAASVHVTVGEISDRLRAVFGEYRESF